MLMEIVQEKRSLLKFYFESDEKIDLFENLYDKERLWKYEIENLFEHRIQNMMITIDKANNFLDRQDPQLPASFPLLLCSVDEIIEHISQILKICIRVKNFDDQDLKLKVGNYLKTQTLPRNDLKKLKYHNSGPEIRKIVNGKYLLLLLSEYFKTNILKLDIHPALIDILYFESMTRFHFKMNNFREFEIKTKIRECDLTNHHKFYQKNKLEIKDQLKNAKKVICTTRKKIPSSYLWAQLISWNQQTLEKPEAYLESASKGTILYPSIHDSFINTNKLYKNSFPKDDRREWIHGIRDLPGEAWGQGVKWSFQRSDMVFGSFLADDFFSHKNERYAILDVIDDGFIVKLAVFKKIWKQIY